MPLYKGNPPEVSLTELRVRVREHYDRAVMSSEGGVDAIELRQLGPRSISYPDSRTLILQMNGCRTRIARKQMAYTMLAVGATMLEYRAAEEVQS